MLFDAYFDQIFLPHNFKNNISKTCDCAISYVDPFNSVL